eukprot:TRINITY_DN41916_c0_g1_i1.p1 TRINITY_DN41916_c0_g1~~TRINITY_DN41916_c0_g1_i1.p1  ORF type:complete len:214 (+),score=38.43 TRINITY_DN41916_c0_g1_i1:131-772(+)
MASRVRESCTCIIRNLSGRQYVVEVETTWSIMKLREYMSTTYEIPEYQQCYYHDSIRMLSNDLLFDSTAQQKNDSSDLTLVRAPKPECFSQVQVQECWRYFRIFSRDNGDTVDGTFAKQIARFAGLDQIAHAIRAELDIALSFNFVDLMCYFEKLNTEPPLPPAPLVDAMLVDVGRTTCPRLGVEQRFHGNRADIAEADASDDESYEETDDEL